MVETCSLTLYNINKTVVLTCRSINCRNKTCIQNFGRRNERNGPLGRFKFEWMLNAIIMGICRQDSFGLRLRRVLIAYERGNEQELQKFENFLTSWVTVSFQDGIFSVELFS